MPRNSDDPLLRDFDLDELTECRECGALNPPGGTLCTECGAPLEDRASRVVRRRAITRARNALTGVRGLYWVYAVGLIVAALRRHSLGVPTLTWELGVVGLIAGLGAMFLYRFPVVITIGIALVHSAWTAMMVDAGDPGLVRRMVQMAIALWIAVPIVVQASRFAARDEYAANRLSGFKSSAGRSEARERASARRATSRRAAARDWAPIVLGILGVAAVGLLGYRFATRPAAVEPPPPIEGALQSWELALRNGNLDAAEALCTEEYRARWPKVVKILEREGWEGGVAIQPPFEYRASEVSKSIHFDLPRGKMKTTWIVEDGAWRVNRVVMSKVRARSED